MTIRSNKGDEDKTKDYIILCNHSNPYFQNYIVCSSESIFFILQRCRYVIVVIVVIEIVYVVSVIVLSSALL